MCILGWTSWLGWCAVSFWTMWKWKRTCYYQFIHHWWNEGRWLKGQVLRENPPHPGELKEGSIKDKIDPNKIHSTPWSVLVWCKWYAKHGINPVNGLVQVQHRPNWNHGCPFIDFTHCLPRNCQCWPSVPFDVTKYDKDGKLIEVETDIMDRSEELQDVIEHHE